MRPRLVLAPLLALAVVTVAGCAEWTGDDGTSTAGSGARTPARVERVVDGDTLKVAVDGRTERVRVLGIDTPESKKEDTPVECGATDAATSMTRLAEGRDVVLVRDPGTDARDRYDRILAYVELDGADLGERQVEQGWAKVYAYEDFQRESRYRRAQESAARDGRGVHGGCDGNFHSSR